MNFGYKSNLKPTTAMNLNLNLDKIKNGNHIICTLKLFSLQT